MDGQSSDWKTEEKFWDDKYTFDEKSWKVILVDFGFAKALAPKEIGGGRSSLIQLFDKQARQHSSLEQADNGKPGLVVNRRFSFERRSIKAMSAVGTRAYAAPEVTNAHEKSSTDNALTSCVSDYGFISDSYSVGSTIKVLLTGVPANVTDILGFMSANSNPILNILSAIFSCGKKNRRQKRYKFLDETPKSARELIGKLMQTKVEERLAVPLARDEPWIRGGITPDDPVVELADGDTVVQLNDPVVCLRCSVQRD